MQGWVSGIALVAVFAAVAVATGVVMARLYLTGRPAKHTEPTESAKLAGPVVLAEPAVLAQLAEPGESAGPAQEAESARPGESADA